jgi:cytoskeleton protein RodZ
MASLGQGLREAREARHISIEEIASSTKIVPRYLEALENDHLEIMPGGFFIKGIIRAYAKAIGLDGEEVLAKYKAAELLGEPERRRHIFQKAPAEPAPPLPPSFVTPPPAEPAPSPAPEAEPAPAPKAATPVEALPLPDIAPALGLLIEPAPPKPRLSPAARKRILSWAWRAVAFVAVVAVLAVLWSSRRPRPPQAKPAAVAPETALPERPLPTTPQTIPGAVPSTDLAGRTSQPAQPAPDAAALAAKPEPEPPAAVEAVWKGVTIEITFNDATWIHVRSDGEIKIDGVFPAGTSARAQADDLLLIHTGNAGGFTFLLNGQRAKPLGRSGQVLTDIKITPASFKEFLEVRPPGPPAG